MRLERVTIINAFQCDRQGISCGDEFPEIVGYGYIESEARDAAIRELRRCGTGWAVDYFEAFAFIPESDEEGWNIVDAATDCLVSMEALGECFYLPSNYCEYTRGGRVLSLDLTESEDEDDE